MLENEKIIQQLPAGYTARPVMMDDLERLTRLFNIYEHDQEQGPSRPDSFTLEDIRGQWQTPEFLLDRDTISVWTDTGEPVGYVEVWDLSDLHIRLNAWGCVHPEHRHQGIGSFLIDWMVERGRKSLPAAKPGARVVLQQSIYSTNQPAARLFASKGFEHIRDFYRMRIDFDEQPPQPVLPEGILLRAMQPGEERAVVQAVYDSFLDHWGAYEQPFEPYFERWMHMIATNPDYDPNLYFLAMDGDQIAGISLCYSKIGDDPDMGWVGTLGVRRPWRRKGLGLALLRHSFRKFYEMGRARAGLGVDASSLTGATRLYEGAGMYVERMMNMFEFELRPGITH